MKEKKTKRGNQPYYTQYLNNDTTAKSGSPTTDKRQRNNEPSERAFDKPRSTSKPPYGTKSFDKPFGEKRTPKNEEEKRFNKPTGYKSSFKGNNSAPKPFEQREERKPYAEKRPFEQREERKPYGEKRPFEQREERKPYAEKRPFEQREERKPYAEKRPFEQREERKPYGEERPERKPYGEKRPFEQREERKPYGEKRPFEQREERKPYGEKRPFEQREEKDAIGQWPDVRGRGKQTFEKPAAPVFEKRGEQFEKLDKSKVSRYAKSGDAANEQKKPRIDREGVESRRVGDFTEAPRYNMERAIERLPNKKKPTIVKNDDDDLIRINRYIANAGVCSRREADDLIGMGQITVNGKVVTELGAKIKRSDVVKYAGRTLNAEKVVYILVNKPKDYITTTEDPEDRHTVMELIAGACAERVYPVGRLDRNTTGLLLFTNDGDLAEKLMHPSNGVQKIYQVELDKAITTEHFEAIKAGLELEDGFVKPDEVGIVTPDGMVIGIEIHSGRNRIVRRIFEHLGYDVLKLDRTAYAGLNKKDLPRGKWRFLDEREVVRLKYML
ncbi:MAG: pseudouridine synthase [Runella slithyformis]|nr:MAG: pseudouridine synthase [Runella slithyformis]